MGCSSCGTANGGKPSGCKSNGGCSSGGCNRLNVYDWLNNLPLFDGAKPYHIVEVSFNKGSRKEFFRNSTNFILEKNEWITVEGVSGIDVGQVSLTGELVKLQMKKYGATENSITKRVLHPSTEEELTISTAQKGREQEVMVRARAIAKTLNLEMKLCEVEIQADGKKGTFFYTADQRVDFRELIKLFANDFRMKIEMRQIGARQESAKVGGIGSCGRELCCSTWLSDFKSVNTTAARYQNLSINQAKLSGQCGRLKCCLNYELDTYLDALSVFPDHADHLETVKGVAHLQKRDIFKNLMWYSYSDNNKQYPLSIVRVKEILKLNRQGQKADELQPLELEPKPDKQGNIKIEVGFVNDVGQLSLKNLEKNKKKKPGNKPQQRDRQNTDAKTGDAPAKGGQRPEGGQPGQNRKPQRQGNQPPKNDTADTGEATGQPQSGNPNRQQQNRPKQQPNRRPPTDGATPEGEATGNSTQRNERRDRPDRQGQRGPQQPKGDQQPRGEQQPKGEQKPNNEQQARREQQPRREQPNRGDRPPRADQPARNEQQQGGEQPNRTDNQQRQKNNNRDRNDRRGGEGGNNQTPRGERPDRGNRPERPSTPPPPPAAES